MERRKSLLKGGCFLAIVALVVTMVNSILTPKYLYDNVWPMSQTYMDFYDMEKDSVDVLFLGSSHAVNAFSPLELYENYGITSYNLGSEQQSLVTSYYWLKEALRYQKPKVVVLDTFLLYLFNETSLLNSEEFAVRKAFDFMKWSPVKMEAVNAICEIDPKQDKWSYYFPNIRYHERWNDIKEDDLTFFSDKKGLMGFSPLNNFAYEYGLDNLVLYQPYEYTGSENFLEPEETMMQYLNKIVALCKEEDIELVLVKAPANVSVLKYNYIKDYADSKGVDYIDFNLRTIYDEMEYDIVMDNNDPGHANYMGMQKICNYLGPILIEKYGIEPKEDSQYEALLGRYAEVIRDCELRSVNDMVEYLDRINDDRYAVFISVNGDGIMALTPEVLEKLTALGCRADFSLLAKQSYIFIKNENGGVEKYGEEKLTEIGALRDGKSFYTVSSAGDYVGNSSSIIIDDEEYSKNQRGMNIVVYSLEYKKVIDQVCFSTYIDINAHR